MRVALAAFLLAALGAPATAQDAPAPALSETAPKAFKPEATPAEPDTWIFSGTLEGSNESFSGTLLATKDQGQLELKLGGGATCDDEQFSGGLGLLKMPEVKCSDDRTLKAIFVPQGHEILKVFGHVGDERFAAEAHLLGEEPPPEPRPSAAPHGPLGLPPTPAGEPPPAASPPAPKP